MDGRWLRAVQWLHSSRVMRRSMKGRWPSACACACALHVACSGTRYACLSLLFITVTISALMTHLPVGLEMEISCTAIILTRTCDSAPFAQLIFKFKSSEAAKNMPGCYYGVEGDSLWGFNSLKVQRAFGGNEGVYSGLATRGRSRQRQLTDAQRGGCSRRRGRRVNPNLPNSPEARHFQITIAGYIIT